MPYAREHRSAALHGIRESVRRDISEDQAKREALDVFQQLGYQKIWHPVLIRIGANTSKTWRQKSDPAVRLGEHDSYFIDLGLVFAGHEGDVGDTFVVGERAASMGWRLNHAVKGHRVSDFRHALHKGGDLGALDARPAAGLWILEIQLAHPSKPFGAFHEDLLDLAPAA